MKLLDLIIDALENSEPTGTGWVHVHEQKHQAALAAARELRELKPVATRNGFSGVIEVEWGESVPIGTKLYALGDEK